MKPLMNSIFTLFKSSASSIEVITKPMNEILCPIGWSYFEYFSWTLRLNEFQIYEKFQR